MKLPPRLLRLAGVLAALGALAFAADTVVVKIQTTALRAEPRFIAPAVGTLAAGASLEKLSERNGWVQVRTAAGKTGWVHGSAVQTKRFALTSLAGNANTKASANELALAGKGFNKQVEDSYRAKNAKADFAGVDRMLKLKADAAEVDAFIRKGKLAGSGGGK